MPEDAGSPSVAEVPHPIQSYPFSDPGRSAVTGGLFGMSPAPVDSCRILELGCRQGGNIVPLAEHFSGSEFIGIDSSEKEVGVGNRMVDALGLTNVKIMVKRLDQVGEDIGEFDYIIAQGLYSWVNAEERDRLLEICQRHLAGQGIVYIAYNTNPGWRMRGTLRDVMMYHTRGIVDPGTRTTQARAIIAFLSESVPEGQPYGDYFKSELALLKKKSDSFLIHDVLSEINEPCFFHQFVEHAARHELQYLGEAEFHTMLAFNFPEKVYETLKKLQSNMIASEQYMDFLRNRTFRQTLLCQREVRLDRNIDGRRIRDFHIGWHLRSETDEPDLKADVRVSFRGREDLTLSSTHPLTKAFLYQLSRHSPHLVSYGDLITAARKEVEEAGLASTSDESDKSLNETMLCRTLLQCYTKNLINLSAADPAIVPDVSDNPKVPSLVRLQAAAGLPITSRYHVTLPVDIFTRQLIVLLDGQSDLKTIRNRLIEGATSGPIEVKRDGARITDKAVLDEIVRARMEGGLRQLARRGFLVG